jgi:flavin reductase (DIM6/NTAB) family NADH-FMN oxidoreductase RutF
MLASAGVDIARRFSSALVDKFAEVRWCRWGNLPHLSEGTFAVAACRVSRFITVGDHTIILGVVTDILSCHGQRPLMYRQRTFASWPEPDDQ